MHHNALDPHFALWRRRRVHRAYGGSELVAQAIVYSLWMEREAVTRHRVESKPFEVSTKLALLSAVSKAIASAALLAVAAIVIFEGGEWSLRLFTLAVFAALAAIAYATTGRLLFSIVSAAVVPILIFAVSRVKLHFLGLPFLYFDVLFMVRSNVADLMVNDWHFAATIIGSTLSAAAALLVTWVSDARPQRKSLNLAVLVALATLLGIISLPAVSRLGEMDLISWNHKVATFFASSLRASARLSLGTVQNGSAVLVPDGKVQSASLTVEASEGSSNAPAKVEDGARRPDLIVVLEESTFDLRTLLESGDPVLDDFFEPPQGKHGKLRVHTFGGGTWLAEFGLLTAIPHVEFGRNGNYAPFLLEGRIHDSLPLQLNRLGYETIAAYSSGGNFVNARRFYTSIGFRHFLDSSQLAQGRSWSWRTSDKEILGSALQALSRLRPPSDARPAFLMTLTLNQHGPHGPTKVGLDLADRFSAGRVHGRNAARFGEYLARLYASAEAIATLKAEYRRLFPGRPVILLHFGDHHPDISRYLVPTGIANEEDELDAQNLPDLVRTTYFAMESIDFELKPSSLDKMKAVDIAHLGVNLLQSAGLVLDPTWKTRARLAVACEGAYADCRSPLKASLHQHLLSSGLVTD